MRPWLRRQEEMPTSSKHMVPFLVPFYGFFFLYSGLETGKDSRKVTEQTQTNGRKRKGKV